MKKIFNLIFLFVTIYATVSCASDPEYTFDVIVTSDAGSFVSGAEVKVRSSKRKYKETVLTNNDGMAQFSLASSFPTFEFRVEKEGYYDLEGGFDLRELTGDSKRKETFRLVINEIENPIPLFAKKTFTHDGDDFLPKLDAAVGYDLMAGDWVSPYGDGKVSDFIFTVSLDRSILVLEFRNEGDGIFVQEATNQTSYSGFSFGKPISELRLPKKAPESDFMERLVIETQENSSEFSDAFFQNIDTTNYFYRVRTELDENGEVLRALYGKIHGIFNLKPWTDREGKEQTRLYFHYYLNPTWNDRNLEFDPERNLFTDLKRKEKVWEF